MKTNSEFKKIYNLKTKWERKLPASMSSLKTLDAPKMYEMRKNFIKPTLLSDDHDVSTKIYGRYLKKTST